MADKADGTPRWVKALGAAAVLVALLFVVLTFVGGHGPRRHGPADGGDSPPAHLPRDHAPPPGAHTQP